MPLTTQSSVPRASLAHFLLWGVLTVVLFGVMGLGVRSLLWQAPLQQMIPNVPSAQLPIYGAVPDFTLTDQTGHPVRRADLEGKTWVASFIFTNCADECPLMTGEMVQLQSDLAWVPDFRLVSISVDPERDVPTVLLAYADRLNADPKRWLFLTGEKRAVYHLVRDGFRLGLVDPTGPTHTTPLKESALDKSPWKGDRPVSSTEWPQNLRRWLRHVAPATAFADHGPAKTPLHSTRFVLVDRHAQIRGYYESQEVAALQRFRQHLQMLIREG